MYAPDTSTAETTHGHGRGAAQVVRLRRGRHTATTLVASVLLLLLGATAVWFTTSRIAAGRDISINLAVNAVAFAAAALIGAKNFLIASKPTTITATDDTVTIAAPAVLRHPLVIPRSSLAEICIPVGIERPDWSSRLAHDAALIGLAGRSPISIALVLNARAEIPWRRWLRRGSKVAEIVVVTGDGRDGDALRAAMGNDSVVHRHVPVEAFPHSTPVTVVRVAVIALVVIGTASGSLRSLDHQGPSVVAPDFANLLGKPSHYPTAGCVDHFPSDPQAQSVPCSAPHLEELIGSTDTSVPGHPCTAALRATLGPDVIDIAGATLEQISSLPNVSTDGMCAIRFDTPVNHPLSELATLVAIRGAWAQEPGVCLIGSEPAQYRPIDCNQPHPAEVVSGPILRADGGDVGQLCTPPLREYQAPARSAGTESLAFVFRSDSPNAGRCVWLFTGERVGSQRSKA